MAQLDPCKVTEPDAIPCKITGPDFIELCSVLTRLFQKCLSRYCFLSLWIFPTVIFVFKNYSDRAKTRNYMPIFILPIISKHF